MSWHENPMVAAFLDDMVDVGIKAWALMAVFFAVMTAGLWGGSIIPFGGILALVMTANLAFATAVTIYWKYIGQPKRQIDGVLSLVDEAERFERKRGENDD